jgi:hypothetical protein
MKFGAKREESFGGKMGTTVLAGRPKYSNYNTCNKVRDE